MTINFKEHKFLNVVHKEAMKQPQLQSWQVGVQLGPMDDIFLVAKDGVRRLIAKVDAKSFASSPDRSAKCAILELVRQQQARGWV